jgi:hypothetical protein
MRHGLLPESQMIGTVAYRWHRARVSKLSAGATMTILWITQRREIVQGMMGGSSAP